MLRHQAVPRDRGWGAGGIPESRMLDWLSLTKYHQGGRPVQNPKRFCLQRLMSVRGRFASERREVRAIFPRQTCWL